MATATTRNLGKTGFVKEVLNDNPQATTRAVNEAWAAAGFEGTIGPTLVTKMRSEMGLTGNIPNGPATGAGAETGTDSAPASKKRGRPKGSTVRGVQQGKTAFVRDFIRKNPTANRKAVEEAWLAAGNEGPISSALVSNLRSKLGLTAGSKTAEGDVPPESVKPTARKPKRRKQGRPAKGKVSEVAAETTTVRMPRSTGRDGALAEVERDIDRLIFRLMGIGGMETIEDELRKVRRLLYSTYSG